MQFIKKLLIYFVGTVFNKLIVFILLPLYTRHLLPEDYGNADLSLTTVTMLVSLLFMEVWTPLLRYSYDCKDREGRLKVYCNVIIVVALCAPLFVLGCIAFTIWQNLSYVVWMIIYGFSILIMHILQFEVRADGNSSDFMISGMISSVLQLVISFMGIYLLRCGAEIIIISPAISNLLACLYLEFKYKFVRALKKSNCSLNLIVQIVKYSFPLAINAVAFWGMTNINRYFSREYLGAEYNGYIALATKFVALVNTLVQVYSLAWQESAYENSNSSQRSAYYSKMLVTYLDIMTIGTVIIILATNILFPFFIGEEYIETQLILPIYYVSALASALSNFYGHIFNAEKKTSILLYSTIAGAAANIIMLYLTINKLGVYSIPVSLILGYCVNVAMRMFSISFTVKIKIKIINIIFDTIFLIVSLLIAYSDLGIVYKVLVIIAGIIYIAMRYKQQIAGILIKLKKEF